MVIAKKATKKAAKAGAAKSNGWVCEECGLEVTVDDWGNAEVTEFLCCTQPMASKKVGVTARKPATKAKPVAKAKPAAKAAAKPVAKAKPAAKAAAKPAAKAKLAAKAKPAAKKK